MMVWESIDLASGVEGELCHYQADGAPVPDDLDPVWELVIRPRDPWISPLETEFFSRSLRGDFAATNVDHFYSIWLGGRPAAHAALLTAVENHHIGMVAYVITAPECRGQGLCQSLVERLLADFRRRGGVCALLATGNAVAQRVYARCGFETYNGHVMRYLSEPQRKTALDQQYFAFHGQAQVRAGHWGDGARLAWLYARPAKWLVKDYGEALYDHPAIEHSRCGSILPAMMSNVEYRGGGLWVLETGDRRIVGAATLRQVDTLAQSKAPAVDFLCVPAYWGQAPDLVRAALEHAARAGAYTVRAFLASPDREKAECVQGLGFRLEATLPDQFAVGKGRHDLKIFGLTL